jgi:hypothetical protein
VAPILGLYKSVVVALTYLRRNQVQVELAEDLDQRRQYIMDGTLLPCWSWAGHRELYSGEHKTTGRSVQVACTLDGELVWSLTRSPGSLNTVTSALYPAAGYAQRTVNHQLTVLDGVYAFAVDTNMGPLVKPLPTHRARDGGRPNAHQSPLEPVWSAAARVASPPAQ